MFRLRLLWVGKTQEAYLEQGMQGYLKRLKAYAPVECEAVKPSSSTHPDQRQQEETERLLKKLDAGQPCVVLDERGERQTSQALAQWLEQQLPQGWSRLTFVIGGSHGFVRDAFPPHVRWLRLSDLTLNHQMIRLVLLEQLYRAFTIIRGEPYHH